MSTAFRMAIKPIEGAATAVREVTDIPLLSSPEAAIRQMKNSVENTNTNSSLHTVVNAAVSLQSDMANA